MDCCSSELRQQSQSSCAVASKAKSSKKQPSRSFPLHTNLQDRSTQKNPQNIMKKAIQLIKKLDKIKYCFGSKLRHQSQLSCAVASKAKSSERVIADSSKKPSQSSPPTTNLQALSTYDHDLLEVASCSTSIPVSKLDRNERERWVGLADRLLQRVVGQDEAVKAVANAIQISLSGLGRQQQLIGSFLLLGPTGVGKTELAKALAEELFDDENMLVKIHMSNYTEKHSIARLIGAGDVTGQLTEPVISEPCSVILFENVDRAHVAVCDMLLQVLKDGRLTDGQGRNVDFTNTIIIMTSTLGSECLLTRRPGYTSMKVSHDLVLQEVKMHFRGEFLDKIGKTLILNQLSQDPLREVANRYLKDVAERFTKKGIALHVTDAALDVIISKSDDRDDHVYGARSIQRSIEERVTDKLAVMFVRDEIVKNSTVYVEVAQEKDELVYRVE